MELFYVYYIKNLHQEANPQFFSIQDCFGTTSEKVSSLIYLLTSIYTMLYIDQAYLRKFDAGIIENIKASYGDSIEANISIIFEDKKYDLIDV